MDYPVPIYRCNHCKYTTNRKSTLMRHLNKKNKCWLKKSTIYMGKPQSPTPVEEKPKNTIETIETTNKEEQKTLEEVKKSVIKMNLKEMVQKSIDALVAEHLKFNYTDK